jgi:hypothetical protein
VDIRKKEGQGINISVKVDFNHFKRLIYVIKVLGQRYESKSNTNKLDYSLLANFQKLPYMKVKGWCSRCIDKNGKISEVFFCDYDNILWRLVKDELLYLIEEYDETPFYVFSTSEEKDCNGELYGNYLIVGLKKHTFKQVIEMQDNLHCDQAYKKIPLIYRFKTWVLRLGPKGNKNKPKFKCVIGDLTKEYKQEISEAHLIALKSLYKNLPNIKYLNKDGGKLKNLFVTEYFTASK